MLESEYGKGYKSPKGYAAYSADSIKIYAKNDKSDYLIDFPMRDYLITMGYHLWR